MKTDQTSQKPPELSPIEKAISVFLQVLAGGILFFIFLWIIWLA